MNLVRYFIYFVRFMRPETEHKRMELLHIDVRTVHDLTKHMWFDTFDL